MPLCIENTGSNPDMNVQTGPQKGRSNGSLMQFVVIVTVLDKREMDSSTSNPQPCLNPSKSEWRDGQRRILINEAGKCIRENTAL